MQQLTILLDSGERKTVVLSKSEFFELPSDQSKIFPEVYGILPTKLTLPVSPMCIFDKFEGMRVQVNSYKQDVDSPLIYKLWFIEK